MNVIKHCNVCVMGGAGFLGSQLVDHLIEDRKCRVLVLDNLISGQKKHVHPNAEFVWHDIRDDEAELVALLKGFHTCYVFNYAAEPYVPECWTRPRHFFSVNAVAVLNVLNACQRALVKGILQVSSAEIYGDSTGKIKESDPIIPHSTYGVSKVAADGLVQVRWREAGVPAIAMRQFNCVGPRETHEYVIPEIISQLHKTRDWPKPTVHLGNNSVRDFQFSGDAVRMAVELLEQGSYGEVYNMGSEECIHIYELAHLIAQVMDLGPIEIVADESRKRPWEIWHLQSDNAKLYEVIGRRQPTPLATALEKTVQYFYNNGYQWDW